MPASLKKMNLKTQQKQILQSEFSRDPAEDERLQIVNEWMLCFLLHSIHLTTLVVSLQMEIFLIMNMKSL